ncbi:MAG: glycosyltransferase family 39 protein [Candidatus Binatia bacterium]
MRTRTTIGLLLGTFMTALAVFAAPLASVPFFTKGEGREAVVVRSMLAGEGLILPRRDGTIASKPPLFHWLATASVHAGVRPVELAIRLPSLVLGAAGVAFVAVLGARWYGLPAGVLAATVLGSSREWIHAASQCRVDMTLTAALLATITSWTAVLEGGGRGLARAGWIAAAFAVLAKGPVGVVLPLLVVTVAAFAGGRGRRLPDLLDPPGIIVFVAAVVGWYGAATVLGGRTFVARQLLHENLQRFLGRGARAHAGHAHPFYYYGPALAVGFLPWSLALPAVIARLRRSVTPRDRTLLAWTATVFLFYSLSAGKRIAYLLPLFPPLAILVGAALATRLHRPTPAATRAALLVSGTLALAVAAVVVLGYAVPVLVVLDRLSHDRAHDLLPVATEVITAGETVLGAGLTGLAASLVAIAVGRDRVRMAGYVAFAVLLVLATNGLATALGGRELSPRAFAERARTLVGTETPCVLGPGDFALSYYFGRRLPPCRRAAKPSELPRFVVRPAEASVPPGWRLALADPRRLGRTRFALTERAAAPAADVAPAAGTP